MANNLTKSVLANVESRSRRRSTRISLKYNEIAEVSEFRLKFIAALVHQICFQTYGHANPTRSKSLASTLLRVFGFLFLMRSLGSPTVSLWYHIYGKRHRVNFRSNKR